MNLSVIFHGDWEVYAHRDPVSGKRELLQEHIARCEKYRIRISQERKLLKIEEKFLTKLGLDKDDFAGKLVKEMIDFAYANCRGSFLANVLFRKLQDENLLPKDAYDRMIAEREDRYNRWR